MKNKFKQLIKLLQEVRKIIDSPETDVAWSRYYTLEEALSHLDLILIKLKNKDETIIDELKILFAPTGSFQEISISSGWGDSFLRLASKFDSIIR